MVLLRSGALFGFFSSIIIIVPFFFFLRKVINLLLTLTATLTDTQAEGRDWSASQKGTTNQLMTCGRC